MWCWRRLLRVPWTAKRSNQSILKEISPGCSLEGLMLKMKLQYFGHLMRRADSFEKTLVLGTIEGRRRRGQQRMRWLDGITYSMDMGLGRLWELVIDRKAWRAVIHGVTKSRTRQRDWTELNWVSEEWLQEASWSWLQCISLRLRKCQCCHPMFVFRLQEKWETKMRTHFQNLTKSAFFPYSSSQGKMGR